MSGSHFISQTSKFLLISATAVTVGGGGDDGNDFSTAFICTFELYVGGSGKYWCGYVCIAPWFPHVFSTRSFRNNSLWCGCVYHVRVSVYRICMLWWIFFPNNSPKSPSMTSFVSSSHRMFRYIIITTNTTLCFSYGTFDLIHIWPFVSSTYKIMHPVYAFQLLNRCRGIMQLSHIYHQNGDIGSIHPYPFWG